MSAAPIVHDGVDLVENHRPNRLQHFPAGIGSEEQVKRLRRRDQNVRRRFDQRLTLGGGSIAGPNLRANTDIMTFLLQQDTNSSERFLKIFANVVAQGFEWRDVNDLRFIRQSTVRAFAKQLI